MKLFRASGNPINKEAYLKEMNKEMDKLEIKHGKACKENIQVFQKGMAKIDKKLAKKFPLSVNVKFPETPEEMREFTRPFGAVAFCEEGGELIGYIMDT